MDNAVDAFIAIVLLVGLIVGAKRGLFKSLMGFAVVLGAMVGAVVLSGLLTEPVTDIVAPKIEDRAVEAFSEFLDRMTAKPANDEELMQEMREETMGVTAQRREKLDQLLEKFNVPTGLIDDLVGSAKDSAGRATEAAKDKAVDAFRSTLSPAIRKAVSAAVHLVLMIVLYFTLLIALRLAVNMLDHVLDLPGLSTLNGVGGALLGLLEALLLLYVVVYLGTRLGMGMFTENAENSYLLPLLTEHSPVELLLSLMQ